MSSLVVAGDTSGSVTISAPAVSGSSVLTLPTGTDTLVGLAATQTLTNKSIVATQLTGTVAAARLPAGSVVQVVSATKTDTFATTSSTTYVDVTGLSVSITPASNSNKILIIASISVGAQLNAWPSIRLLRGSTNICIGDASSNRDPVTGTFYNSDTAGEVGLSCVAISFLDSPATTSSTTYKIQTKGRTSFGAGYVNRTYADNDDAFSGKRAASTITVMEIAG